MEFLSANPVSNDFIDSLRADLSGAEILRFAVAYISQPGLNAVDMGLLARPLQNVASFGVSTLTCGYGDGPLRSIASYLPQDGIPRLKYFLDPKIKSIAKNQPDLIHSKLIYLKVKDRSVVYVGSHNWTQPALRTNAEASIRLEQSFDPEHLDGIGASVFSKANRHLRTLFELPLCFPVSDQTFGVFEQWKLSACPTNDAPEPLKRYCIILAVFSHAVTVENIVERLGSDSGIYLQVFDENSDGQDTWNANDRIFVLVWRSKEALRNSHQPLLLICRSTSRNASAESSLAGANQARTPIAGFSSVLWDPAQCANAASNLPPGAPLQMRASSGLLVRYFELDVSPASDRSEQIDNGSHPLYQHMLRIEHVVMPTELPEDLQGEKSYRWELRWTPASLAFSERPRVPIFRVKGYEVDYERAEAINECLRTLFHVDPSTAAVPPLSSLDHPKAGRRVADHSLHETYLSEEVRGGGREFYRSRRPRKLVPDLDRGRATASAALSSLLPRVLSVFTDDVRNLLSDWEEIAAYFQH